jgi:hypothetical protein
MRAGAYGLRHGKVLILYRQGEGSIEGTPKVFKKGRPFWQPTCKFSASRRSVFVLTTSLGRPSEQLQIADRE